MPLYLHHWPGGCTVVQARSKSAACSKLGLTNKFQRSRIVRVPEFTLQLYRGGQGQLEHFQFGPETARFLREAGCLRQSPHEFPQQTKEEMAANRLLTELRILPVRR